LFYLGFYFEKIIAIKSFSLVDFFRHVSAHVSFLFFIIFLKNKNYHLSIWRCATW